MFPATAVREGVAISAGSGLGRSGGSGGSGVSLSPRWRQLALRRTGGRERGQERGQASMACLSFFTCRDGRRLAVCVIKSSCSSTKREREREKWKSLTMLEPGRVPATWSPLPATPRFERHRFQRHQRHRRFQRHPPHPWHSRHSRHSRSYEAHGIHNAHNTRHLEAQTFQIARVLQPVTPSPLQLDPTVFDPCPSQYAIG